MGNHKRVTAPEIPTTTTAAMAEASCFIAKSSLPIHRALRVPASEGACGWDQIPLRGLLPDAAIEPETRQKPGRLRLEKLKLPLIANF